MASLLQLWLIKDTLSKWPRHSTPGGLAQIKGSPTQGEPGNEGTGKLADAAEFRVPGLLRKTTEPVTNPLPIPTEGGDKRQVAVHQEIGLLHQFPGGDSQVLPALSWRGQSE